MISTYDNKGADKACNKKSFRPSGKKNAEVSSNEDQLMVLFRRYDTDGDGRLSKQELHDVFKSLGSTFPAWSAWRALRHADANSDGYVNKEEFSELAKYVIKRGYGLA